MISFNRYNMRNLIILIFSLFAISCQQNKISDLECIEGEWKVEGKEKYEVWERVSNSELKGNGYKIKDEKRVITEKVSIKEENGSIVYRATVADQNEGATIGFVLNELVDSCFSFENMDHDFPKKIQYKKISDQELHIKVLGEGDKGFSFVMKKE